MPIDKLIPLEFLLRFRKRCPVERDWLSRLNSNGTHNRYTLYQKTGYFHDPLSIVLMV